MQKQAIKIQKLITELEKIAGRAYAKMTRVQKMYYEATDLENYASVNYHFNLAPETVAADKLFSLTRDEDLRTAMLDAELCLQIMCCSDEQLIEELEEAS